MTQLERKQIHGGFNIPTTFSAALSLAAKQQERIEQQQALLESQAPMVAFANAIIDSKSTCLMSELANLLTQNGFVIDTNELLAILREKGYLSNVEDSFNMPHKKHIDQGLFKIKRRFRNYRNGITVTKYTPKVTGKGQVYFVNKFLNPKITA